MADDPQVNVDITATDDTQPGLDSASENVSTFGDQMEDTFQRVGERLIAYFAIEKVLEFTKSAIEESAAVGRAFDILGAQVDAAGGKWKDAKSDVEDFIQAEQVFSGSTKEDLLQALTAAETKTRDLGIAMKITDDAQKLALVGIGSLTRNIRILASATDGSQGGIMALGKALGESDTQAKNAAFVFQDLANKIAGVGKVTDDAQGQINKLAASWDNLKEAIGGFVGIFEPVIQFVVNDLSSGIQRIILLNKLMDDSFSGNWGHILTDLKDFDKKSTDIWMGHAEKIKVITDNELQHYAEAQAKAANAGKAEKAALEAEKKREALLKRQRAAAERELKKEEKANDDELKAIERAYVKHIKDMEKQKKLHDKEEKEDAKEQSDALYAVQDNFFKVMETLGTSGNEKLVEISKQAAAAKIVISTAEGVAQALGDYPYPFSLAVGALVGVEGALELANVEGVSFANGGIVPGGSYSGDHVPAMVNSGELILNRAQQDNLAGGMGGGDHYEVHVHVDGSGNRAQAHANGQTSGLAFIKTQQAMKVRAGVRNTGF